MTGTASPPVPPGFTLREATVQDAPALAELKLTTYRETFLEDFAIPYPPEDRAIFEAETYGLEHVTAELADAGHRTWVIESTDGTAPPRLVAYAHVGPGKLPHPDMRPGEPELYQIYLRREVQGSGLGKPLLAVALAHMAAQGSRIWIGVWSGNHRARHFYARHGFETVGGYQFPVGTWRDDELILRRDTAPGGMA